MPSNYQNPYVQHTGLFGPLYYDRHLGAYQNPYAQYHGLFTPRYNSSNNTRFPYVYNRDRMDELVSEMNFPEIVPAGSEWDLGQQYGFGKAFERKHKREDGSTYTTQDRAHYLPIPFLSPQIGYSPSTSDDPDEQQLTILEEFPHVWLYNNGMQGYPEMLQDFMLYGGSAQQQSYTNPFAFEGFTHGLYNKDWNKDDKIDSKEKARSLNNIKKVTKDLGLENLLVDFDGDGKKDYIVPGFTNASHGPVGAQYWVEAFRRGNIDKKTRDKAIKIVNDYHQKGRTDAYYDQAWNLNTDDWTKYVRGAGFTDGGDLIRTTTPFLNTLNFFVEGGNVMKAKLELWRKEQELETAFKSKSISKEEYDRVKKLYKTAEESLNKRAYGIVGEDYANAIKATKRGDLRQGVSSALRGNAKVVDALGGMGISLINASNNSMLNLLPQKAKTGFKQSIYFTTNSAIDKMPDFAKDAVKTAQPYIKEGAHTIWNALPSGSTKDAIKDNRMVKGVRNFIKHYGFWKNGGVLNIQDMLIY